ncbi:hypothetical protein Q7A53_05110 [Halobacillus rhizosphaerae]|uniref:hypothetical protein n=1 Tax=Halobacillus rhizosphaerae TaxID=3064889 RepID=UPI00398AAB91
MQKPEFKELMPSEEDLKKDYTIEGMEDVEEKSLEEIIREVAEEENMSEEEVRDAIANFNKFSKASKKFKQPKPKNQKEKAKKRSKIAKKSRKKNR